MSEQMTPDQVNESLRNLLSRVVRAERVVVTEMPAFGDRTEAVDRTLTLSAAHRLIQSLSEQTQSRAELDECRDVMSQLGRMVDDA